MNPQLPIHLKDALMTFLNFWSYAYGTLQINYYY